MLIKPIILPQAKLLFVGEAPGAEEERSGIPFVGRSGQEFNSILDDAGIKRSAVSITNVFLERPPDNNLSVWAIRRAEAIGGAKGTTKATKGRSGVLEAPAAASGRSWGLLSVPGGVVDPARSGPALSRLGAEIAQAQPNVIVALGNIALQALCGLNGIGALRGTLQEERLTDRHVKVIPTYHPAGVMRKYEWRPGVVFDFMKAKHQSTFSEIKLYDRKIHVEPTLEDLQIWRYRLLHADYITFDIETKARQITCIGFAPSRLEAYVLPFWCSKGNYWPTLREEIIAWQFMKEIMESLIPKVAQNGLYDVQYLAEYGIATNNFVHDTMILHHSLYPALPKSLAFLGSLYATERAWKRWRIRKGDTEELKRES